METFFSILILASFAIGVGTHTYLSMPHRCQPSNGHQPRLSSEQVQALSLEQARLKLEKIRDKRVTVIFLVFATAIGVALSHGVGAEAGRRFFLFGLVPLFCGMRIFLAGYAAGAHGKKWPTLFLSIFVDLRRRRLWEIEDELAATQMTTRNSAGEIAG
jgi:hypothetical protein